MGYQNTEVLNKAMGDFIGAWGGILNVFIGLALLLGLLGIGYSLTQIIMHSDKPAKRDEALANLTKAAIGVALLGGFWTLVFMVSQILL